MAGLVDVALAVLGRLAGCTIVREPELLTETWSGQPVLDCARSRAAAFHPLKTFERQRACLGVAMKKTGCPAANVAVGTRVVSPDPGPPSR